MPSRLPLFCLLVLALSACTGEHDPAADDATLPGLDQPAADIPPATAEDIADTPAGPVMAPGGGTGMPAPGTIRLDGFGPAAFGAGAEAVRMAWGGDLGAPVPSEPGGCYYLMPQPQPPDGYRIAFMVEGDRFSRLDVRTDDITAPGGGRVGMTAAEIEALYPGRIERRPHKYVDGGHYLRIGDASGEGVLLFATDADGAVTEWRVGLPPQVDYVEGCS
jgi:hypothetical protein